MIKGIFCHDLPIYKDCNGVYCCTTLTDDVFKRYFQVVDELTVATRIYNLECTYSEAHQEAITLSNIHFLDLPNLNKPQYVFSRMPNARKQLKAALEQADLVFIRGGIIGMLAAHITRQLNKPYLVECGGRAWDEYWNYSIIGKIVAPYMEYNARKTIKEATYVIYVTEKWLQKQYPTNGHSAGISDVVIKDVSDDILKARIMMKKETNKKVWTIGTAAGLNNKLKGQQFVIEAISRLKDNYNIRYEIVGTGDASFLQSVAKKYDVEDRIVFKGELTHDEVLFWMDSLDAYIQPSLQEGLPRAVIEAMSRACLCMGTNTAGIPELIEREMLFEKGNVSEIEENHCEYNFRRAKDFEKNLLDEKRRIALCQYKEIVLEGE